MSNATIVTGDGAKLYFQLYADGAKFYIPPSATVTVRLISVDHELAYSAEADQLSSNPGSDWANGLVAVELSEALTEEILAIDNVEWNQGRVKAKMEIQVDSNGKETWFDTLSIVKGNIS